jgi:hypothetical protein
LQLDAAGALFFEGHQVHGEDPASPAIACMALVIGVLDDTAEESWGSPGNLLGRLRAASNRR